jgi:hypothetical protein
VIEYGITLLEIFYGGMLNASREELRPGRMIDWLLEMDSPGAPTSAEVNWYLHFQMLMKHPVINLGVYNAAWHRFQLPGD